MMRKTLWRLSPIAMVPVAAVLWLNWKQAPPRRPLVAPLAGRPECPHDWDFKRGQMALVGSTVNVPEFHDCQRFIVYDGTTPHYQALYAIFAASDLNALDTAATVTDSLKAAAEIYAEGTYPQLGISNTYSCLYLFRDPAEVSGWGAKIVPVENAEVDCRRPVTLGTQGTNLEVKRTEGHFVDRDYPAVARWDWDAPNRQQYIGIKCGRAWCDVGPRGFNPTPAPAGPRTASIKFDRTRLIKGWYDQQFLATLDGSGRTIPTRIWGTIYPDSGLDDYDTVHVFRRGRWVQVAQVALEVPNNPTTDETHALALYKQNLNLEPTIPGGVLNTIYLCRGAKGTAAGNCRMETTETCDGEGQWWAMILDANPADGSRRLYKCIVRRAHDGLGVHVPGTARWRWLASDETTWKRCENGCCEVQ